MKLRQKLAVALASAMVVTAVPVVTMAASTNALLKETIKIKEDGSFTQITTANAVKMAFKDNQGASNEIFYLDLSDAKWEAKLFNDADHALNSNNEFQQIGTTDAWYYGAKGAALDHTNAIAKYELQDKSSMKVTVYGAQLSGTNNEVVLPVLATMTGADAKVAVVTRGGSTTATASEWVFATASEKKATYKVGDLPSFYTSGEVAELVLTETYTGSLADGAKITLEIADSDFRFEDYANVQVKGSYGFGNMTFTNGTDFTVAKGSDEGSVVITFNALSAANKAAQDSMGTLKVTGLKVKATTKTPEAGELLIDVKSDNLVDAKNDVAFAKIAEYATFIEMKDEKAVEIVAGRIKDVEFTIGETVEDSIVGGREFEIKLDNANIDYRTIIEKYSKNTITLPSGVTSFDELTNKQVKALNGQLDVAALRTADLLKDKVGSTSNVIIDEIEFARDKDDLIDPTTLIVTLNTGLQTNKNIDKMTFKLPVAVSVANKEKETVKITAEGRALETEVSTTAVTIVNPFNVETEALTVKVGLQKQKGGKITLTETDKDMIKKGDITFAVEKADSGISFSGDVTLATEGGIKNVEIKTDKAGESTTVTLNRTSKEAATISVEDFIVTVDRTVPEGSYDLKISGDAIDAYGESITIEDFIVVGTPNTQDITASNGLVKGTAIFEIGKTTYTAIDGTEKTMDAASYIQDPGYTMVPVRYVAEAFGVSEQDILFGNGVVTIFAGTRTIQLTNGSNIAVVNGAQVAMGTKVAIKEGRTYAPVGEIARILGISTAWDATAKTATFTNK